MQTQQENLAAFKKEFQTLIEAFIPIIATAETIKTADTFASRQAEENRKFAARETKAAREFEATEAFTLGHFRLLAGNARRSVDAASASLADARTSHKAAEELHETNRAVRHTTGNASAIPFRSTLFLLGQTQRQLTHAITADNEARLGYKRIQEQFTFELDRINGERRQFEADWKVSRNAWNARQRAAAAHEQLREDAHQRARAAHERDRAARN